MLALSTEATCQPLMRTSNGPDEINSSANEFARE